MTISPASPIATTIPQYPHSDPPVQRSGDIPGSITEEDALKRGESAKMEQFSLDRFSPSSSGSQPTGAPLSSGNSISAGSIIEGRVAIEVIDSIVPSMLVLLFHYLKMPIKKSEFQFTAKEKETLIPLGQKCLDHINLNFDNPFSAFFLTMLGFYIAKIAEKGGTALIDKRFESMLRKAQSETKTADAMPSQTQAEKSKSKQAPVIKISTDKLDEIKKEIEPYNEEVILKTIAKRRKGRKEAIEWLEKFWYKNGGVLNF